MYVCVRACVAHNSRSRSIDPIACLTGAVMVSYSLRACFTRPVVCIIMCVVCVRGGDHECSIDSLNTPKRDYTLEPYMDADTIETFTETQRRRRIRAIECASM